MIVSFWLFTVPPARAPQALLRMGLDRGPLQRTRGLRFFKLVGTGNGRTFTVRDADPTRWGIVAAWDTPADRDRFERTSPVAAAWERLAVERWRVDLMPLRSRGQWAGVEPFSPADGRAQFTDGPIAALTRARIRWPLARRFWQAVPPVSAALQSAPGLQFAIGFGEAPVGLQGTFSIWDSAAALHDFSYASAEHRRAIADTHELGWYREELFARFAVVGSTGTVGGHDPVHMLGGHA